MVGKPTMVFVALRRRPRWGQEVWELDANRPPA
jgi:hypothetical protein